MDSHEITIKVKLVYIRSGAYDKKTSAKPPSWKPMQIKKKSTPVEIKANIHFVIESQTIYKLVYYLLTEILKANRQNHSKTDH